MPPREQVFKYKNGNLFRAEKLTQRINSWKVIWEQRCWWGGGGMKRTMFGLCWGEDSVNEYITRVCNGQDPGRPSNIQRWQSITLIISAFGFNSRMQRNCTPLGRKLKFPVLLDSKLWDTSITDVYQTEPGGKEMSNANVRAGQAIAWLPCRMNVPNTNRAKSVQFILLFVF